MVIAMGYISLPCAAPFLCEIARSITNRDLTIEIPPTFKRVRIACMIKDVFGTKSDLSKGRKGKKAKYYDVFAFLVSPQALSLKL